MRKSFYDIIKGRDKKENKRKKNEFLPRTKNVVLKQGMDEEGRPAHYRQSDSPNYPARRASNEAAGRDSRGKAESKETASNRQKKKEDPIYTLSKLAEMKNKSFDINKGLTSRSFPQIGFVNRAYNPNTVFDNATRVVSTPARPSESFVMSPVAQDPMFKSCMAHNRQYDVRKGCLQCSVEKSNSCNKCGGQLNKSMQYGAICTNCTPVK